MRHRPDHQCHLLSCFQLHGLDGLVLTPVGGRERGPLCHGAHLKVVAAAGKPLRAEVVAAAGTEVVASADEPSVQRWSPSLANRRCRGGRLRWRTIGAEVVTSAGEDTRS
jgi:hypothetical protein